MALLNRIRVNGFKSIREMDLQLKDLNILIGANGAGKSNFIGVFRLLNEIIEKNLQLFVARSGGADSLLHYGQKTTQEIIIHLEFGKIDYDIKFVSAAGDTLIFGDERVSYTNPKTIVQPLGKGHKETQLFERNDGFTLKHNVIEALRSWKVYHFHDTSRAAAVKQSANINDNAQLRPDAGNLASFLYLLQSNDQTYYQNIVQTIQLVAPFFQEFVLRPMPQNPEKIKLEWKEKGSDQYFDANSLSDGTLRFICLATLLLQPMLPSTILIDEPELGLHPYAITLLASILRSTSKKTQVIVSTQSVPLINQFLPEDVIVVDRKDGQSVFSQLSSADLEDWLEDYALGELWEKNVLGGRPQRWEPQR